MGDLADDCYRMGEEQCDCPTAIYERDRAERAERERDEALRRLDEAHLARIEAQNPGIDIERVREQRGEWGDAWGAGLSADADADAEPNEWELPGMWEAADLSGGASDGASTEPSRAEGDEHEVLDAAEEAMADAEGGRPREADPPAVSGLRDDASVDGEGNDGRSRAEPMRVGDRLHANPCDVVVIARPTSSFAFGRCDTCGDEHILDAGLFDQGRGPWRRKETDDA